MTGIDIRDEEGGCAIFEVRVIPRSSKSEIVGPHDGALKVKLRSAPVEGAANEELIKLLGKAFHVARGDIEIIAGQTSKNKRVRLAGVTAAQVKAILRAKT